MEDAILNMAYELKRVGQGQETWLRQKHEMAAEESSKSHGTKWNWGPMLNGWPVAQAPPHLPPKSAIICDIFYLVVKQAENSRTLPFLVLYWAFPVDSISTASPKRTLVCKSNGRRQGDSSMVEVMASWILRDTGEFPSSSMTAARALTGF